jgi:hypothetical protein
LKKIENVENIEITENIKTLSKIKTLSEMVKHAKDNGVELVGKQSSVLLGFGGEISLAGSLFGSSAIKTELTMPCFSGTSSFFSGVSSTSLFSSSSKFDLGKGKRTAKTSKINVPSKKAKVEDKEKNDSTEASDSSGKRRSTRLNAKLAKNEKGEMLASKNELANEEEKAVEPNSKKNSENVKDDKLNEIEINDVRRMVKKAIARNKLSS